MVPKLPRDCLQWRKGHYMYSAVRFCGRADSLPHVLVTAACRLRFVESVNAGRFGPRSRNTLHGALRAPPFLCLPPCPSSLCILSVMSKRRYIRLKCVVPEGIVHNLSTIRSTYMRCAASALNRECVAVLYLFSILYIRASSTSVSPLLKFMHSETCFIKEVNEDVNCIRSSP